MRFFRTSPEVYTAVRAGLDAAFGHPKTAVSAEGVEVVTLSCLPAAEAALRDGAGNVLAPVSEQDCSMEEVAPVLSGLLASGTITEMTEEEWRAAPAAGGEEPIS